MTEEEFLNLAPDERTKIKRYIRWLSVSIGLGKFIRNKADRQTTHAIKNHVRIGVQDAFFNRAEVPVEVPWLSSLPPFKVYVVHERGSTYVDVVFPDEELYNSVDFLSGPG